MLKLRDQKNGPQAIAMKLNTEGRMRRCGKPWTRQTLWRTLDNRDELDAVLAEG